MNTFLRSGALADEIRDIGAGSQLVELLVSEAPSLFEEAFRLRSERTERERLSSDIADEGNEAALVWEKSENVAAHKRRCCDRSILGEETLERWQPSQRNIGRSASLLFFPFLFNSFSLFLLFPRKRWRDGSRVSGTLVGLPILCFFHVLNSFSFPFLYFFIRV